MAKVDNFAKLTGKDKAAIVMMSISEENAAKVFSLLHEDEIKEISQVMSSLGTVSPTVVERTFYEFSTSISETLSFVGNLESTERLLANAIGKDRVDNIMEDIRGPAGRNTWDKLGNVSEEVLANYLKGEYPQTVSLIISKLHPSHAAKVLAILPEELTSEVILRMLEMESIKKEVLETIERSLRAEFISNIAKTQKYDSNEMMAEIFNNFDRGNEAKYMEMLEQRSPDSADKVKSLMFTFDDLNKSDEAGIQALLRGVDKSVLGIALKGTTDDIKNLFIKNMSSRAAKIMEEDMEAMGPVRLKEVDEAQTEIINAAKELISSGEMTISQGDSEEDELVY